RCLADTAYISQAFHFEADEEIRSAYTYLFENWSRASEAAVIQQMFSLAASSGDVYLELEEEARENASPELLLWTGNYELILVHQMENLPSIFKGQIIFHLAPDERGHWVIFYWLDNAAPGSPGWSGLKARLGG
ncbi:hypothetical protein KAR48_10390, partial [bacterium]|nr:hypothetical protein [bacterium]